MKWNVIAVAATIAGGALLFFTDRAEAFTLATRLLPIFVFVIGMSVVVNIAAKVQAFEAITAGLQTMAPAAGAARQRVLWTGLIVLSIISTVFLSLDTTAILITPLAVAVARRNHLHLIAVALAVVWIANIASLPLPVSNLTNLLALNGPAFSSTFDYARQAFVPAISAILVALAASWLVNRRRRRDTLDIVTEPHQQLDPDPLRVIALTILAVLLPLLASPIPYWISSSAAAALLLMASLVLRKNLVSIELVPWQSLLLATVFSTVATAANSLGGAELVISLLGDFEQTATGLFGLAWAGAALSNLINNIPAFLALEPAVHSATGYLALLIGTNAGPIITPWASLATLLWHDQLARAGIIIKWRTYMLAGSGLIVFALMLPLTALVIQGV